jgi:short-subunit dehydrogenase
MREEIDMNVFVTGASYGMGRAITNELARHCSLILIQGRDKVRLSETSEHAIALGAGKCLQISQELADSSAVDLITTWITQNTTTLDVIILNAGFYREGNLSNFPPQQFQSDFFANVHVNLFLIQNLLPLLNLGEKKRIVIIGSTAAYEAYPLVPAYGVQKWALRGLALNLRNELRDQGVGVTFVAPGATLTGMWEGENLPQGRLLDPSDVAKMVVATLFLSPQAVVEEIKIVPMLGDLHD